MKNSINPKLKKVHIGQDVWMCGVLNQDFILDGKRTSHAVIYGPNKKVYHAYGNDAAYFYTQKNEYGDTITGNVSRHGNFAIESKLKIYILTSILDEKTNWCFDLKKIPTEGKLKVIYGNGTVKNIDFDGQSFQPVYIENTFSVGNIQHKLSPRLVYPVAYRI